MRLLILVTDDDLGTRLSISHYLEMSGYSAITAEDGLEALKLVEKHQPHLLVTDVIMPQMDGYELVRRIRQQPLFRLLPVVFLTARTTTQERIRGYQLGCDVYLPKPFDLDELGAIVRNLLERSQLIQSEWRLHLQSFQTTADLHKEASSETSTANITRASDNSEDLLAAHLTRREHEVLALLTEGLSNNKIGDELHLSPRTVEKYVSSLLRKTTTSNRAELVHFAVKHHLIT